MAMDFMTNIYIWIGGTFLFAVLFLFAIGLLIYLSMKTHMIMELKAFIKKKPLALFFQDSGYCEFKVVTDEAGIIEDKKYGSFIINETGSYIERKTRIVILPFDTNVASSLNMRACKVSEDLKHLLKDETQMEMLRKGIALNTVSDEEVCGLKTSINVGAIKSMMNAMLPHNITAKVNMMVAQKMSGWNKINYFEIGMMFCAIFGAIVMGVIVIKMMVK
jgi:hypothetical protein